jgi:hypothetical protein
VSCPNSAPHCSCGEHALGLLAFTVNDEHRTSLSSALDLLRGPQTTTLSVLTFDPEPAPNLVQLTVQCDDSYDCRCAVCVAERARRVQNGGRRADDPFGGMPVKIRRAA